MDAPKAPGPFMTVEDGKGHKIPYVFRKSPKNDAPLLIIMHGNGANKRASKYVSENYNVLCPLDCYGLYRRGSWFLGVGGDFFYMEMFCELIENLISTHNLKHEIYICGSSMGGYAAIVYGLKLRAHAIFAHIPQVNLYNSHWYLENKANIDRIFASGDFNNIYRDIASYVCLYEGPFPLMFLSFNRFDSKFYMEEHLHPLRESLEKRNKNYFLSVHPYKGHVFKQNIAYLVDIFEQYQPEIQENFKKENSL